MSNRSWSTNFPRAWGTSSVLGLVILIGHTALAQDIPPAPPIPATAPAAPAGFIGKCTSCIGSIGGCFKGCCNTPLGKLINGAFQPIEMATGGVIPSPCPGPNDPSKHGGGGGSNSPAGGPPGPQQAAEAIKKDQAQAKARVEAVKYLATVPCHYYPEAEAGLILALRTDRSECVRWEAAHALAQGCCCTKKTIEALKIVVSGSQRDGNPSEKSFRVKVEALNALEHCLAMCGDAGEPQRPELPAPMPQPETIPTPLPQPKRPELPLGQDGGTQATPGVQQVNYYEEVEKQPTATLLAEARRLVDTSKQSTKTVTSPRRGRSLVELWRRSDRSDEVAMGTAEETVGPVRVELPSEPESSPLGQPTLAPPRPPSTDMVSGIETTATPAPVGQPYANQMSLPVPYLGASATPNRAAGSLEPGLSLHTASSGYDPLPPSLPEIRATESLPPRLPEVQALPPLWTTPDVTMPLGETALSAPGEISAAGPQGYLYPSTPPSTNTYGQPTHVAQQPEWLNPLPRK